MLTIIIFVVLGILVLFFLVPFILRYWQEETNMTEEDHAFDRSVASLNNQLANQQRDEDIREILSGRAMPTVADRYRRDDDDS